MLIISTNSLIPVENIFYEFLVTRMTFVKQGFDWGQIVVVFILDLIILIRYIISIFNTEAD